MKHKVEKALQNPVLRFAIDVANVYFGKRISRAASELAYCLILTFFPILICVSSFVGRLHLDLGEMLADTDKFLPSGVTAILEDYLGYLATSHSPGMLVAGIFLTVLFASAAVRGLMNVMHEIYGRATFRGLSQLAASILFSLLLLATIYLSLVVVLTGNWFFHLIEEVFRLEDLVKRFGTWQWMKYLILLALVFLFILLLYRFTAPLTRPRPPVIPGALGASVALAIASIIFSGFVGRSTRYSLVYGSLASVIIMLVWLYLCGNILILGNVANYVIYQRRLRKTRPGAEAPENK